ncbi:antibiotic biosynthesis monooxygenase [Erwinia tracheiphila]|uniref:Antibiotic biosynthesis monooxygenase n=1 Tax=Erwinia tracheiphila TaxID=65700 RepID=A0A345CR20_9GAMM|nr:putative quinol monooxygenase [Erwinia tracheiphila]AXF75887.1 antibiotic biosynthesis monooxygenase [Erwinia tracheiphila]EOS96900.1 antibiotic biosynthesis monooxygenase [Erwinia tracheiphila PSU-1]UIA85449.1 antibiotic biosynthesis monooxygenase [Erwinia tracheiphila]UIA86346.1 antibiotic biosynthesis monooxygenase [Erwinia tracheiphila]UIA93969.1 antibiotic biosynthesis monooxygenase [Erwinia tracheiphila]
MSDKNIRIVAKFISAAGKADELKKVLSAGIKPARAEEGCLHYDLYRSVEDGNVFLFHETWKDAQSVDIHGGQPHTTRSNPGVISYQGQKF